MSNLSNIDLKNYSLFAFTEQKQPFKTEVRIDSGYVDFLGCDFFEIDSGTIICFKNGTSNGFHDLRLTGEKVDFIQITPETNLLDLVVNETSQSGYNFYIFLDSTIQEQTYAFNDSYNLDGLNLPNDFVRCDYRKFGGTSFYDGKSGYDVVSVGYALGVSGIGHILRIGTSNSGNLNQGSQAEYTAARTLTALMKLIYEWSVVSEEPFNNQEKIASSASLFLETLNLSDEVMSDILSSTGDMVLARYLKGDTHRSDEQENAGRYEMPESFANYIKQHYSYPNLYEMQKSLGLDIFDESLINNYLKHFEEPLFKYFYDHGIDVESYGNLEQIYQLETTPNYIKKYIMEYRKVRDINL
jgi:hypothetical protein